MGTEMKKKELVFNTLKELGLKPYVEDGMIVFMYQLKTMACQVDEEQDGFVCMQLPHFYEVDEEEKAIAAFACVQATRDLRMVKVFLDEELEHVSASIDFFIGTADDIRNILENVLLVLGVVSTWFASSMVECSHNHKIKELWKE